MSISDNYVPDVSTGNGVTVAFSGSWNVIASAYFVCQLKNISTGVLTDLDVPGTDGTLAFTSSGYTATLSVAPSSAYEVVRSRNITKDQNTPYKTSLGFQGLVEENSFDKITAIAQDLQEQINRTPQVSIGTSGVFSLGAPTVNSVLYWSDANTISASNVDITTFNANVTATASEAAAAAVSQSAAAGSATSASGSASTATAQAVIATAQAVIATAKAVLTAADRVQTGLDVTSANSSASTATTQAGLAATAKTACDSDKTACDADVVLTHADVVLTHADVVTTGNNVTTTNTNVTSTATSASAAAASATAAAASAAAGLYNQIDDKTFSDSPIVPLLATSGNLYRIDTSGGNVVVNLSALATYAKNMILAFVKTTADANTITINRGGTDTISGQTSIVVSTEYEVHVLVGETSTGKWLDTVQTTGIADGAVTTAKLAAGAVTEAKMTFADNTTGNMSTAAHGLMPKAVNTAGLYYDAQAGQTNPALNSVLTGYTSGAGTVAATDTILAAIQKLNGNVAAVSPSLPRTTQTTTYAPTTTDKASEISFAGAGADATWTIVAGATNGAGWYCIFNNPTLFYLTIKVTTNTIDGIAGATGFKMYPGEMRMVQCDGTNYFTTILKGFWINTTSTFTFTVPPGYQAFDCEIWGGGAGGGTGSASSGGGGGGYNCSTITAATMGSTTQTVTVGAAGSAGAPPTVGGETSIGSLLTAFGGGIGVSSTSNCGGGGGGSPTAVGGNASGSTGGTGGGNQGNTLTGAGGASSVNGTDGMGGGGGGGGAGGTGGSSFGFGGGGGGSNASVGGNAIWGGGGGGGTSAAGGKSIYGGNGGTGGGAAGVTPAGGGGRNAAGGSGQVWIRGVV